MHRLRNVPALWVPGVLLLAGLTTILAAEQPDDIDPVVQDVARMLEAEIETTVILQWLQQVETPPETISADDLILLKRAGAPQEVVERLLEMSEGAPTPELIAPTSTPPPSVRVTPPAMDEDAIEECCEVDVSVLFRPFYPLDDLDEDTGWDLYVYLDGSLLARAVRDRAATTLSARLSPGEHTLRLLWELHARQGRGESATWEHEARVAPETLRFDLPPAEGWKLEVVWDEGRFGSKKKPLSWNLVINGGPTMGESALGTPRDRWPVLCDEVEASIPEGKDTPGWARRAMKGCVSWSSLWEGLDTVPGRDQARDEAIRSAED